MCVCSSQPDFDQSSTPMVVETPVVECSNLGGAYFSLELRAEGGLATLEPGQFCMLQVPGFFLRRPLGLAFRGDGTIGFLVRAQGEGTRALCALEPGRLVSVLGPLGRGFGALGSGDVLVGGGIGAAPLASLMQQAQSAGQAPPPFIVGLRGLDDVAFGRHLEEHYLAKLIFEKGPEPRGLATDALGDLSPTRVLACGPWAMLAAVATWAREREVPCLLSLEARMGCGFGVCLGCAVPQVSGGYLLVCKDGPVVDGSLIDFSSRSS